MIDSDTGLQMTCGASNTPLFNLHRRQRLLAVNNAKLRSLMKNLAVTDEKSGLLKRSSYLDVLLSETKRAFSQNSTALGHLK